MKLYSSTHTFGGKIDPTAIVGHAPEHRDWKPGDPAIYPEIDKTARLEAFVTVDAGMEDATRIGARSWLLKHSHVGHDASVGEDCEIACGAVIGGHCVIEDGVKVGLNATVLPYRRVGRGARVGAGAVVTRDIPAGEVWIGNPARPIDQHAADKLRAVS